MIQIWFNKILPKNNTYDYTRIKIFGMNTPFIWQSFKPEIKEKQHNKKILQKLNKK